MLTEYYGQGAFPIHRGAIFKDVTEKILIEFKGDYYQKGHPGPQSVLVQFDGVLLHVWHMSEPFHRLLTSDVFRLPASLGKRSRCIKLPNGSRIETDDLNALGTLQSNGSSVMTFNGLDPRYIKFIAGGGMILLLAAILLIVRCVPPI